MVPSLFSDFFFFNFQFYFLNYLLLLVGMFPVVPVFCGLVGRRSLGGMCHGGEVVCDGDASGNDALHGGRDPPRGHAHHPRRVPGGQREEQAHHQPPPPERLHFSSAAKGQLEVKPTPLRGKTAAFSHLMCVTLRCWQLLYPPSPAEALTALAMDADAFGC